MEQKHSTLGPKEQEQRFVQPAFAVASDSADSDILVVPVAVGALPVEFAAAVGIVVFAENSAAADSVVVSADNSVAADSSVPLPTSVGWDLEQQFVEKGCT
jgi:hypothetical protein